MLTKRDIKLHHVHPATKEKYKPPAHTFAYMLVFYELGFSVIGSTSPSIVFH